MSRIIGWCSLFVELRVKNDSYLFWADPWSKQTKPHMSPVHSSVFCIAELKQHKEKKDSSQIHDRGVDFFETFQVRFCTRWELYLHRCPIVLLLAFFAEIVISGPTWVTLPRRRHRPLCSSLRSLFHLFIHSVIPFSSFILVQQLRLTLARNRRQLLRHSEQRANTTFDFSDSGNEMTGFRTEGNSSVCRDHLSNWLRNQTQIHLGPLCWPFLFFVFLTVPLPHPTDCCCCIDAWRWSIARLWRMTNGAAIYFMKINESIYLFTLITRHLQPGQSPWWEREWGAILSAIQSLFHILALTYWLDWLSDRESQTD